MTGAAAQLALDKARRLARYNAIPMENDTDRLAVTGAFLSAEQDERR
jgi:hypothetical protein